MIKIGVIDCREAYRSKLIKKLKLNQNIDVIVEGDFASEVYSIYSEFRPDIILMDIDLNLSVSIESMENLLKNYPNVKIIALTNEVDELFVKKSIQAGASAYVLKGEGISDLIDAINNVDKGYFYIHPKIANLVLKEYQRLSFLELNLDKCVSNNFIRNPRNLLTKREVDILQLLVSGKSNKEIGESIFLSDQTIKKHVSNILSKMDVKHRTQAVVLSIKNGWIKLD